MPGRVEAGIAQRYEGAAAAERTAQGKTSGTVRVEDEGVVVVADLPKKVSWDRWSSSSETKPLRASMECHASSFGFPSAGFLSML